MSEILGQATSKVSPSGVIRDKNVISLYTLYKTPDIIALIEAFRDAVREGYPEILLDYKNHNKAIFPNIGTPVAAIIHYVQRTGIRVRVISEPPESSILKIIHLECPLLATEQNLDSEHDVLSRIWEFQDEKMLFRLVNELVKTFSERLECTSGVLHAFEWCLNEVMDNVLQHSNATSGFVMAQVHKDEKKLAVCVSDMGVGIFKSLSNSKHKPSTVVDALTLCVQEGVTRDPSIGQGNGLWGLLEITRENGGSLSITSGSGALRMMEGGEVRTSSGLRVFNEDVHGTIVDFQVKADGSVDLGRALKSNSVANIRLELTENDSGEHSLFLKDHAHGTGSRRSGEQMRLLLINMLNEGARCIILDFSDIGIISSSFADELVGKLIAKYGFYEFQNRFRLVKMSTIVQGILHRSVAQRMASELSTNS